MKEGTPADSLITRLRRIEGQVRGIQRMLEEGRDCEDVLTQIMAARSGIEQVGLLLMDHHIENCLLGNMTSDPRLRNLQQALRMWLRFGLPVEQGEEEPVQGE